MEYPLDLQSVQCVLIRIDYEERLKTQHSPNLGIGIIF